MRIQYSHVGRYKELERMRSFSNCSSMMASCKNGSLTFKILAECPVSKARTAVMTLPHAEVETPVFMPVGTQGTLKAVTPRQLEAMDCRILLGNAYHLGNRPVSLLTFKRLG